MAAKRSEQNFEPILNHPPGVGTVETAKSTRVVRVVIWHSEIRMVEKVKELNAEL
jgi:hypothetical protein